jgi:hypothetical protein
MANGDKCNGEIKEYKSVDGEGQDKSEHRDGDKGLRCHTESGAKAIYQTY